MARQRVTDRFLIGLSGVWLATLAAIPWLHDMQASFVATCALIAANALFAFRTMTVERRVLISLNLVQIVLFGVLNYQLWITFDDEHYRCERPPGLGDWVEFTLAHVCRAADVMDALDEYGVDLQVIRHHSVAAGIVIVAMHVGADVFLLGLLFRWIGSLRKNVGETTLVRGRRMVRWFLLTVSLYLGVAIAQGFSGWQWILWPLDNVLRFLDLGDMFQVFHWKLHDIEGGVVTSTFTLAFRLAFGGWTADILLWLHFRFLRGWGIDVSDLRDMLRDGDTFARLGAVRTLAGCGPRAAPALPELIVSLSDSDLEVRRAAAQALGFIGPRAKKAVPALALALWSEDPQLRLEAAKALDRIGPAAKEAIPDLVYLMVVGEEALREIASKTLYRFGYLPERA